jgi:hypothetical protein
MIAIAPAPQSITGEAVLGLAAREPGARPILWFDRVIETEMGEMQAMPRAAGQISPRRFWAIRHDHNELYLSRDADRDGQIWTSDPFLAEQFRDQDHALNTIVERFNGKGQAAELVLPAESAAGRAIAAA